MLTRVLVNLAKFSICVLHCLFYALTFPITLFLSLKTVKHYEAGIVYRFGKIQKVAERPGLHFVILFIETLETIDMRTIIIELPPNTVYTSNHMTIDVTAVIFYQVTDVKLAMLKVKDCDALIVDLSTLIIRNVFAAYRLPDLMQTLASISAQIQELINEVTTSWGIQIQQIAITDVYLSEYLQWIMVSEVEEIRMARAKIIEAEGQVRATEILKQAGDLIGNSPAALQLRYLQTLAEVAQNNNSTIIFPFPMDMKNIFSPGKASGDNAQVVQQTIFSKSGSSNEEYNMEKAAKMKHVEESETSNLISNISLTISTEINSIQNEESSEIIDTLVMKNNTYPSSKSPTIETSDDTDEDLLEEQSSLSVLGKRIAEAVESEEFDGLDVANEDINNNESSMKKSSQSKLRINGAKSRKKFRISTGMFKSMKFSEEYITDSESPKYKDSQTVLGRTVAKVTQSKSLDIAKEYQTISESPMNRDSQSILGRTAVKVAESKSLDFAKEYVTDSEPPNQKSSKNILGRTVTEAAESTGVRKSLGVVRKDVTDYQYPNTTKGNMFVLFQSANENELAIASTSKGTCNQTKTKENIQMGLKQCIPRAPRSKAEQNMMVESIQVESGITDKTDEKQEIMEKQKIAEATWGAIKTAKIDPVKMAPVNSRSCRNPNCKTKTKDENA